MPKKQLKEWGDESAFPTTEAPKSWADRMEDTGGEEDVPMRDIGDGDGSPRKKDDKTGMAETGDDIWQNERDEKSHDSDLEDMDEEEAKAMAIGAEIYQNRRSGIGEGEMDIDDASWP